MTTTGSPKHVLLIDDNADDAELTARALRRSSHANVVTIVDDVVAALDWLTGDSAPPPGIDRVPALVLLDVKMPRVDGFEAVRRLRAHPRTALLPIVLLTSSSEERDVVEGYSAGANAYVMKPITSEEFLAAIQALGSFWLGQNRVPRQSNGLRQ